MYSQKRGGRRPPSPLRGCYITYFRRILAFLGLLNCPFYSSYTTRNIASVKLGTPEGRCKVPACWTSFLWGNAVLYCPPWRSSRQSRPCLASILLKPRYVMGFPSLKGTNTCLSYGRLRLGAPLSVAERLNVPRSLSSLPKGTSPLEYIEI